MTGSKWRRAAAGLPALALVAGIAAAARDDDASTTATASVAAHRRRRRRPTAHRSGDADGHAGRRRTPAGDGATLRVGYSAWPGWFPLAVAEEQGIFEEAGLDVELTYFVDYTASLDALVAGQLDVNTQTLNDTIFARRRRQPAADHRHQRQLDRQRRRHLRRSRSRRSPT